MSGAIWLRPPIHPSFGRVGRKAMRCSTIDLIARRCGFASCPLFLAALGLAPVALASPSAAPSTPAPTAKPLVGTPLPAPPASLPAAKIARGVWRGIVRIDAGLNWSLPLPTSGEHPASGDLFGFGAELGASVRVLSGLGLGLRWGVSPHQNLGSNAELSWLSDARSSNRLMLTARGYWPSKGRVQPFAEVAGGFVYLNSFGQEPAQRGGAWSGSLGLDGLILPGWTLWAAARYRGAYLYDEVGHRLELALGASLHF